MDAQTLSEQLAPHVDRLFVAGHRVSAPYARPLRQEFGLESFGVLIDFRKLLLAPAGMTLAQGASIERYADPEEIRHTLHRHIDEGVVRLDGDRYLPTEQGRALLLRLTDGQMRGTADLWGSRRDEVERGLELATAAVHAAAARLPAHRYPSFTAERQGYDPEAAGDAYRLWTRLATLRYLRADAHALAWREAGITVAEILLLSALWSSSSIERLPGMAEATHRLSARGWVVETGGEWAISPAGRRARQEIEAATNRYNAPAYQDLEPDRAEALLRVLASLSDRDSGGPTSVHDISTM